MTSTAARQASPDTYGIKLRPAPWSLACRKHGLDSDAKIARHLKVSQSTVSRISLGEVDPSPMFIASACKRLFHTFDQLFAFYVKASS